MDNNKVATRPILGDEAKNQSEQDVQLSSAGDELLPMTLPYARVLVVDDVEINLEVAMGIMQLYEMHIDGVTSGRQAIDAIRDEKQKYDAIFMDHFMPDLDGVETVRIIREDIGTEYARTIPIIALTAEVDEGNEKLFLSKGFQAFLPKPIDMARLDAILRQWVQNKELEKSFAVKQGTINTAAQTDEYKQQRAALSKVEGLNVGKGCERFGGKMEIYLQILHSFTVNARPLVESIKGVSRDTLAEYAITVHGLKGSCWGICAEPAGDQAEALEDAAKAGNFDFAIANNQLFIETMFTLIADIKVALRKNISPQDKPRKDKPDREALSKILAACKNYNITEANVSLKELEQFEYESDGELVSWLRENTEQMNCFEIVERLTGLPGVMQ